jgi:hypothetical protein
MASRVRSPIASRSHRRIERAAHIRRETAEAYLRAAGIAVRPSGGWGRNAAKPAIEVSTDSVAEKPPRQPGRSSSASACEPYREVIEAELAKGRNAMAIWQDLVDGHGFAGRYQSVRRFVRNLQGGPSPEACAVIETAPGEDYGESGVMVRGDSPLRVVIAEELILWPRAFHNAGW